VFDVELPPLSESVIQIRVDNNGFKNKTSLVEGRFLGINQLYGVGRSLSNIDVDGLTICQIANASNEIITAYKKTAVAVVSLHVNDKNCVLLTPNGINSTARADMNSQEHIDNITVTKQTFIDDANRTTTPISSPDRRRY